MKAFPAKYAKNKFGHLIDTALQEPVLITKNDRPSVVVMSIGEFKELKEQAFQKAIDIGVEQVKNGEIVDIDFDDFMKKIDKKRNK